MKSASSLCATALLVVSAVAMLIIAGLALFGGGQVPPAVFQARGTTLALTDVPMPAGSIPVNSADATELAKLSGIGEKTAQAIIAEREKNGPFFFPEDLMDVKGIGEKKLAQMLPGIRMDGP